MPSSAEICYNRSIPKQPEEITSTPGLIDFHVHCYIGGSDGTNEVDSFCLPNSVTTCVDGGIAGTVNYVGIIRNVVSRRMTRVITLLHVAPEVLTTGRHSENQTTADIAVWKLNSKRVVHKDSLGKERWGDQVLVPQMTVKDGVIFYCQADFM